MLQKIYKSVIQRFKDIYEFYKIHKCDHEYSSDIQLRVIKCKKCGDKRWYDYRDIYTKTFGESK